MDDDEALEKADAIFQATHLGFTALDALARGEVLEHWDEAALGLAATQAAFRGEPPRFTGILVEDADVAALARLRDLVAAGVTGDEVRDLAAAVRRSFDKSAPPPAD